jgi:hypothetical protein
MTDQTEDTDEEQTEERTIAEKAGYAPGFIAGGIARTAGQISTAFAKGFIAAMPKGEHFYRGIHKTAMKKWLKKSDGDALMHYVDGGMLDFEPVEYAPEEEDEAVEQDMWVGCYSGNRWRASAGRSQTYLAHGKIPSLWACSDATDVGDDVQARVAEALDLGNEKPLYESASVTYYGLPGGSDGGAGGEAIADGGRQAVARNVINVENPGQLDDVLVPIADGEGEGQVVSMEKYYETYPEKIASEEMQMQEERGRLAEADEEAWDKAKSIVMWAMIGAISLVGLVVLLVYLMGSGTISM